jgi:20S proteasome subunit beta 4
MRHVIAKSLREEPYQCNAIIGGVDLPSAIVGGSAEPKPILYFLDYLGSLVKCNYTAHGYCAMLLYGLWDSQWKPEMNLEEGLQLVRDSIDQLQKRFLVQNPKFIVKKITKDGVERVDYSK